MDQNQTQDLKAVTRYKEKGRIADFKDREAGIRKMANAIDSEARFRNSTREMDRALFLVKRRIDL